MMTNQDIVYETSKKLVSKEEWRKSFNRYANGITKNKRIFKDVGDFLKKNKIEKELDPVRIYSYVSLAYNELNTIVKYDLRIYGQSVGTLVIKRNKNNKYNLFLQITKNHEKHNKQHLKIDTKANPPRKPYDWDSEEAKAIISSYKRVINKDVVMHSEERKLETLVLSDLVKKGSKEEKVLRYMQPIILGGIAFFQMPTPFCASNHNDKDYPKYSMRKDGAATGGGIDILARVDHKDGSHRFAVIELKDENKREEPQKLVMQQALVYATFIAHLLRDKRCGNLWYNLFRDQREDMSLNDNNLDIDVITMMPPIPKDESRNPIDEECEMAPIQVPNVNVNVNVTLHPYTLYLETDKNKSKINKVSGSLLNDKKI